MGDRVHRWRSAKRARRIARGLTLVGGFAFATFAQACSRESHASGAAGSAAAGNAGARAGFGGGGEGGTSSMSLGRGGNWGASGATGGAPNAGAGARASGGADSGAQAGTAFGASGRAGEGTAGGAAGAGAGSGNAGAGGSPTCTAPAPGSMGQNPLFSDQFTADPAAMVHGCTFYIQCGHDEAAANQNAFVMKEWFLLSSTDMVHWTKKVALDLSAFQWADSNAWAGQMVERDGKFYWYVPVNEKGSGMAIGVAVADSPDGPFKDALGKALIDDAFEMANMGFATPSDTPYTIDPSVFVDDDGQAYLHYGGFSRMVVAKLGSDMLSIDGKMKEATPQGYFEAAYLIKHGGKYYEIYAAGSNPATIDYSTADSPLGPWSYRGRVLDAFPRATGQTDWPTNHAGVALLAGQWYIVYHVSNGPNGGGTYRREVAIDKLEFAADGTIPKVIPSAGLSF